MNYTELASALTTITQRNQCNHLFPSISTFFFGTLGDFMIKSADFLTKRSKVFPVLTFVGHNCVNPSLHYPSSFPPFTSPCQFRFCFNMHQLGGVEKTAIYAKNLNGRLNCRTNLWAPHSIIVGVYSEPKFIVWVLWDLRLGPKLRARAISFQVKFQSFQNAQSLCYILMDIHFIYIFIYISS